MSNREQELGFCVTFFCLNSSKQFEERRNSKIESEDIKFTYQRTVWRKQGAQMMPLKLILSAGLKHN